VFFTTDKNMRYQQNLSARSIAIVVAALDDVNRRKHPLVHQLAVEVYFHVTRALELFKDHVVHARAGERVDEQFHRFDRRQRVIVLASHPPE